MRWNKEKAAKHEEAMRRLENNLARMQCQASEEHDKQEASKYRAAKRTEAAIGVATQQAKASIAKDKSHQKEVEAQEKTKQNADNQKTERTRISKQAEVMIAEIKADSHKFDKFMKIIESYQKEYPDILKIKKSFFSSLFIFKRFQINKFDLDIELAQKSLDKLRRDKEMAAKFPSSYKEEIKRAEERIEKIQNQKYEFIQNNQIEEKMIEILNSPAIPWENLNLPPSFNLQNLPLVKQQPSEEILLGDNNI